MKKQDIIAMIDREIDNLPPIPDNIDKIRNLINDPKSSNKLIAEYVKRDPSLTANLLRISNSAYYSVINRIDSVDRAINTIGLKKLSGLLLTIGAKKVISERYSSMEEEWEFSQKCSVFSQAIVKMSKVRGKDCLEHAFTSGLLHNIGKIVLLSISPDFMKKINVFSEKKSVETHVIEKISLGMTNADIGAKITEKWKFPRYISKTIEMQDNPTLAVNEELITLTYSVYLSTRLAKMNRNEMEETFNKLNPKVLQYFNINNIEQIGKVKSLLESLYGVSRQNR